MIHPVGNVSSVSSIASFHPNFRSLQRFRSYLECLCVVFTTSSFEQRCVQRKGLRLNCRESFVRFCQICQICRFRFVRFFKFANFHDLKKNGRLTDGPTDGRSDPLIEMRGRIYKRMTNCFSLTKSVLLKPITKTLYWWTCLTNFQKSSRWSSVFKHLMHDCKKES